MADDNNRRCTRTNDDDNDNTRTRTARSHSNDQKPPSHRMVPVPEAIRIVLHETLQCCAAIQVTASQSQQSSSEETNANVESMPINIALGRRLAQDVCMPEPGYPPYRASIMDGYCIRETATSSTLAASSTNEFRIVGRILTGDAVDIDTTAADNHNTNQASAAAMYVTTGAMIPDGYTRVVPVEDCTVTDDNILTISNNNNDQTVSWIRPVGCDLASGELVLRKGQVVDAVALGLLLQTGLDYVNVERVVPPSHNDDTLLRVGVLSTGNEVVDTWKQKTPSSVSTSTQQPNQLAPGCIPDANRPVLIHLYESWLKSTSSNNTTAVVIDLGIVRDDSDQVLAERLRNALEQCDVLVTTGGVSMGDADRIERVLREDVIIHVDGSSSDRRHQVQQQQPRLCFGRLNMKPGKPTKFWSIVPPNSNKPVVVGLSTNAPPSSSSSPKLIFSLPGNPVSAIVCSHLLVRPCLDLWLSCRRRHRLGHRHTTTDTSDARLLPELTAVLTHDIPLDAVRPEYHRVTLAYKNSNNNSSSNPGMSMYATSTGVQRSSRLASLRDAHGLLVLPAATDAQPIARKGSTWLVLLLSSSSLSPLPSSVFSKTTTTTVATSRHVRVPWKVAVVKLEEESSKTSLATNSEMLQSLLNDGSGSGRPFQVVSTQSIDTTTNNNDINHDDATLWTRLLLSQVAPVHNDNNSNTDTANAALADLLIVTSPIHPLKQQFTWASQLSMLSRRTDNSSKGGSFRVANHLAMTIKQGMAVVTPELALAEIVVGVWQSNDVKADTVVTTGTTDTAATTNRCLIVYLPQEGLEAGIRALLGDSGILLQRALATMNE